MRKQFYPDNYTTWANMVTFFNLDYRVKLTASIIGLPVLGYQ